MEDKPRYSRISDLLYLIFLMESKLQGITIRDIQEEFGVSRRTAERMKDAVLTILPSIDEIETSDRQKHWGFVNYSVSNIVSFTSEEISTLEKIKNNFDNVTNSDIKKIITKLKTISNSKNSNILENIEFILKSEGVAIRQAPNYKIDLEVISKVREAIKTKTKIKAKYNNKNKILSPLGIIYGEKVYLIAKEEEHGVEAYCYMLHKLSNVALMKEKYKLGDFDLKKFGEKSFGIYQGEVYKVELEFDKSVKDDVMNYHFHPSQKMKNLESGNVLVKFNASGELHMIWHIFKWGDKVKILKPTKLKKIYKEYLQNVLKGLN